MTDLIPVIPRCPFPEANLSRYNMKQYLLQRDIQLLPLVQERQKGIRTRMYSTTLREDRDGVRREAATTIPSPVSSPLFKGNTRPAYNNLLSPRSPFVFVSWHGFCYICSPPPPSRDQCCHSRCCRAWREIKFNLWAFLKVNRNTHLQK